MAREWPRMVEAFGSFTAYTLLLDYTPCTTTDKTNKDYQAHIGVVHVAEDDLGGTIALAPKRHLAACNLEQLEQKRDIPAICGWRARSDYSVSENLTRRTLTSISRSSFITKYKERVNKRRKQVIFKEGDLVWIRLEKERFPAGRFGKLQPRADGPFRVLKRINDNAYKIELPGEYNVSVTFNVADLSPYVTDEEGIELEETENVQQDSWTNLF
ncbi:hypothetical protein Tco_1229931 [Tanacetum coccineum]